ncbi:DUF6434 domain-containing protein [Tateyamaria sp. SN3-11]|uniref:DUF6434 domain-containing protein n=1 Tax=Tateyamaria sp. SN3-11 TaxID=3092147 RepID=UPI0039ECE2F4
MSDPDTATRPAVDAAMTAPEFLRWYWPVEALHQFCAALGIAATGTKAVLRDRVAYALAHPGAPVPPASRTRGKSKFKWATAPLTRETEITDTVSFGPNLRGFFADHIGTRFVCHGDFMAWVKANAGATLGDAIEAWHVLEARKDDPAFRREIAACNNYLQYLRDIRDAHPEMSLEAARTCWDHKKIQPATDGFVIYEPGDLRVLR